MDPLECSVCMNDMLDRTPRALHCLHSFCSGCLEALLINNTIKCPTCRAITSLKCTNITELKVDFKLAQMRDLQQKAVPPSAVTSVARTVCELCQQHDASYKCKECQEILCLHCKNKHDEFDQFKGHSVLELCQKHQDGVTFMCVECVLPLCKRCMMFEHSHHKNHCVTYDEGVKNIQEQIKTKHEKIKIEMKDKEDICETSKRECANSRQIVESLMKHREFLMEKIARIDTLVEDEIEKIDEFDNEMKLYADCKTECNVAAASLNSLLGSAAGFCQKYGKLNSKADKALEKLRNIKVNYKHSGYMVSKPCSCKIIKPTNIAEPLKGLEVDELVLDLGKRDDFRPGLEMAYLGDDIVLCNRTQQQHIIRMNRSGKVLDKFYPSENGEIRGVQVFDGKVYIAQEKAITVVTPDSLSVMYKPGVDNIEKILVLNETSIIISNFKNPGKIFHFDPQRNKTSTVVGGLNLPRYMSKIVTEEGDRYVVTEKGAHSIRVYDQDWKQLQQFGGYGNKDGQFNSPYASAVTHMNSLLVADCCNSRVSHYTMDGKLIGHIITDLFGPWGLAYKEPYLWFCRETYVKCYKLKTIN